MQDKYGFYVDIFHLNVFYCKASVSPELQESVVPAETDAKDEETKDNTKQEPLDSIDEHPEDPANLCGYFLDLTLNLK